MKIVAHTNYTQIFITSSSVSSETLKQYYIDILTIMDSTDPEDGYLIYFEEKAIAQPAVSVYKKGVSMAFAGDDVIFKYY